MGWEDTVMEKSQVDQVTFPYVTHDRFGIDRKVRGAQAKISFKAGAEEIVGLLEPNFIPSPTSALAGSKVMSIDVDKLRIKLEELGITKEDKP